MTTEQKSSPRVQRVGDQYNFFYKIVVLRQIAEPRFNENLDPVTRGLDFAAQQASFASEVAAAAANGGVFQVTNYEGRAQFYGKDESLLNLRNYVSSITLKGVAASNFMLDMVIDMPYEDAIVLLDHELLKIDTTLTAEWGWLEPGGETILSDKHVFHMQDPAVDLSGDSVSISWSGTGVPYANMNYRTKRKTWKIEQYKTDLDIIRELIKPMGIEIDQQSLANLPSDRGLRAQRSAGKLAVAGFTVVNGLPLVSDLKVVPYEQNESDWQFLHRICQDNNVTAHFIGNTLYLQDRDRSRELKPTYVLSWRRQPQEENEVPLDSIKINVGKHLFERRNPMVARGLTAIIPRKDQPARDANGAKNPKRAERQQLDPGQSRPPPGESSATRPVQTSTTGRGTKSANTNRSWGGGTIRVDKRTQITPTPGLSDDETGDTQAQPERAPRSGAKMTEIIRHNVRYGNDEAQVMMSGLPGLRPEMIVELVGVSKKFNGKYQVREVTHSIDGGGYSTSAILDRSVLSDDPRAKEGGATKAKKNTQPVAQKGQARLPKSTEGA